MTTSHDPVGEGTGVSLDSGAEVQEGSATREADAGSVASSLGTDAAEQTEQGNKVEESGDNKGVEDDFEARLSASIEKVKPVVSPGLGSRQSSRTAIGLEYQDSSAHVVDVPPLQLPSPVISGDNSSDLVDPTVQPTSSSRASVASNDARDPLGFEHASKPGAVVDQQLVVSPRLSSLASPSMDGEQAEERLQSLNSRDGSSARAVYSTDSNRRVTFSTISYDGPELLDPNRTDETERKYMRSKGGGAGGGKRAFKTSKFKSDNHPRRAIETEGKERLPHPPPKSGSQTARTAAAEALGNGTTVPVDGAQTERVYRFTEGDGLNESSVVPLSLLRPNKAAAVARARKQAAGTGVAPPRHPGGGERPGLGTNWNKGGKVDAAWGNSATRERLRHLTDDPICSCGVGHGITYVTEETQETSNGPSGGHRKRAHSIDCKLSRKDGRLRVPASIIPTDYHVIKANATRPLDYDDSEYTTKPVEHGYHTTTFPSLKPTQRGEIIQLDQLLDDLRSKLADGERINLPDDDIIKWPSLDDMPTTDELDSGLATTQERDHLASVVQSIKDEQSLYNMALHEVMRQVTVNCHERGVLLAKVRKLYSTLFASIPARIMHLHNDLIAQRMLGRRMAQQLKSAVEAHNVVSDQLERHKARDKERDRELYKAKQQIEAQTRDIELLQEQLASYHEASALQRVRVHADLEKAKAQARSIFKTDADDDSEDDGDGTFDDGRSDASGSSAMSGVENILSTNDVTGFRAEDLFGDKRAIELTEQPNQGEDDEAVDVLGSSETMRAGGTAMRDTLATKANRARQARASHGGNNFAHMQGFQNPNHVQVVARSDVETSEKGTQIDMDNNMLTNIERQTDQVEGVISKRNVTTLPDASKKRLRSLVSRLQDLMRVMGSLDEPPTDSRFPPEQQSALQPQQISIADEPRLPDIDALNPALKHFTPLNTINVLDHFECKGNHRTLMHTSRLVKTITNTVRTREKFSRQWMVKQQQVLLDSMTGVAFIDTREGSTPPLFPDFVRESIDRLYPGEVSVADQHVWDLIQTVSKFRTQDPLVEMFAQFLEEARPQSEFLFFLSMRHRTEHDKTGVLVPTDRTKLVPSYLCLNRSRALVEYHFGATPDGVRYDLNEKIVGASIPMRNLGDGDDYNDHPLVPSREDAPNCDMSLPEYRRVSLASFYEAVMNSYQQLRDAHYRKVVSLFYNASGGRDSLNITEWAGVLLACRPEITERQCTTLFAQHARVDLISGGTGISFPLFLQLSSRYRLVNFPITVLRPILENDHAMFVLDTLRAHREVLRTLVSDLELLFEGSLRDVDRVILRQARSAVAALNEDELTPGRASEKLQILRRVLHAILAYQIEDEIYSHPESGVDVHKLDEELSYLTKIINTRLLPVVKQIRSSGKLKKVKSRDIAATLPSNPAYANKGKKRGGFSIINSPAVYQTIPALPSLFATTGADSLSNLGLWEKGLRGDVTGFQLTVRLPLAQERTLEIAQQAVTMYETLFKAQQSTEEEALLEKLDIERQKAAEARAGARGAARDRMQSEMDIFAAALHDTPQVSTDDDTQSVKSSGKAPHSRNIHRRGESMKVMRSSESARSLGNASSGNNSSYNVERTSSRGPFGAGSPTTTRLSEARTSNAARNNHRNRFDSAPALPAVDATGRVRRQDSMSEQSGTRSDVPLSSRPGSSTSEVPSETTGTSSTANPNKFRPSNSSERIPRLPSKVSKDEIDHITERMQPPSGPVKEFVPAIIDSDEDEEGTDDEVIAGGTRSTSASGVTSGGTGASAKGGRLGNLQSRSMDRSDSGHALVRTDTPQWKRVLKQEQAKAEQSSGTSDAITK